MAGKKKVVIPDEYGKYWGDPGNLDKFRPPKKKGKAKAKKKGVIERIKDIPKNYKAADKYFAEKWKQRDLKKQIAKKKKKAQELRDAKKKK